VFMHQKDVTKYPECTKLLANLAAALRGKPQVLKAFLDACQADELNGATPQAVETIARRALQWATPPRIVLMQGTLSHAGDDACGSTHTFGTLGMFLEITDIWFDGYEFGSNADHANNANRLTITLLHEIVHWVRYTAGADSDILVGGRFRGHYEEAGSWFEMQAFGAVNNCTPANVTDAILSRRK
jgi:hypothetical protein